MQPPLWLPWCSVVKNPSANVVDVGLIPESKRFPVVGNGIPTSVFLLGKSHGWRNLVGYTPWCCQESGMTEHMIKSTNRELNEELQIIKKGNKYKFWNSKLQNN